jgi:sRNA-binding carbon storage regulator CsrA
MTWLEQFERIPMICLRREAGDEVVITVPPSTESRRIVISTYQIRESYVKLGFVADRDIAIYRGEIQTLVDADESQARPA